MRGSFHRYAAALLLAAAPSVAARAAPITWPTHKRYVQAMTNMDHYVIDPLLAGARVEQDAHGVPAAWKGSFGTVFKVKTRGNHTIALRVFHPDPEAKERQDPADVGRRFETLGKFFARLRAKNVPLQEVVEFAYVPRALRIGGQELPAMKMPWVTARPLDEWIRVRLAKGQAGALATMGEYFRATMRDFAFLKIAHGDLHQGNIVVDPDANLRLLDYDGWYVPTLKGEGNSEIGAPNFQHPDYHFDRRTGEMAGTRRPYDEKQDRASALNIYLTLQAVARDPSLWKDFHDREGGNLIFVGARDLLNPSRSPVIQRLEASPSRTIRGLTEVFAQAMAGPASAVPSLEDGIAKAAALSRPKAVFTGRGAAPSPANPAGAPVARPVKVFGRGGAAR